MVRRRVLTLSGSCAAVLASPLALLDAAAPATQPVVLAIPSTDEVFGHLTSPDRKERQQSIRQLIDLGPAAQTILCRLLERELNAETRKNVELASEQIQSEQRIGPSLITLHLIDATPARIFAEISKQADGVLPALPDDLSAHLSGKTLTLNCDRQPFWRVLSDACGKLGLDYLGADQDISFVREGWAPVGGTSLDGAFAVAATATGRMKRLSLELSVYGEPKLQITCAESFRIEEATDDQGGPLLPQTSRRFWGRPSLQGSRRLVIPLQRSSDDVSRISVLRGTITAVIERSTELWQIDKPTTMEPQSRVIDSVPVTIESLTQQSDGRYQLRLKVPAGWSSQGVRAELSELIRKRMTVVDGRGQSLIINAPADDRTSRDGTLDVVVDLPPRPANEVAPKSSDDDPLTQPAKIQWKIPADTQKVTIPFHFQDLPIREGSY